MMKRILALLLCLMLALPIAAFAESADSADSEFDLSADQEKIAELGVPTVSAVAELKSNADTLWKNGDYEAAARAYAEYAKQANWLANIISGGLEPFYSASYDDRKELVSGSAFVQRSFERRIQSEQLQGGAQPRNALRGIVLLQSGRL